MAIKKSDAAKSRLKPAGVVEELTNAELDELMKCAEDPIYFMENHCRVTHPMKGLVPFKLYDYQKKMISCFEGKGEIFNPTLIKRSFLPLDEGGFNLKDGNDHSGRLSVVLTARQMGKTVTAAMYLLHYAMFNENKCVIIASKGESHAQEIMSRIRSGYEEIEASYLKPGLKEYNKKKLTFDNGSTIICQATSESTGRGYSVSLLYIDEFAFCEPSIQEAMWSSIYPTLATGGRMIMSSTPNGDSEMFARIWHGAQVGTNNFNCIEIKYYEHPDRERDGFWAKDHLANLGETLYRQEVLCEFLSSDRLLVSSSVLYGMKGIQPIYSFNGLDVFVNKEDLGGGKKTYLMGVDPATGSGRDFSVMTIYDAATLKHVGILRSNELDIPGLYSRIKMMLKYLSRPRNAPKDLVDKAKETQDYEELEEFCAKVVWTFERNGVGEGLCALIKNDPTEGVYLPFCDLVSDPDRLGMYTKATTKLKNCLKLKTIIERKVAALEVIDPVMIAELKSFVSTGESYAAKKGSTDDIVMASLHIVNCIDYVAEYDPDMAKLQFAQSDEDWRANASRDQILMIDDGDEGGDGDNSPVPIDAWI